MGRDGRGVRAASKSSIEITFMYQGVQCKERVKLEPTAANLTKVENFRAAVLHAIEVGTFDYAVSFPDSKKRYLFSSKPGVRKTVAFFLEEWLQAKKGSIKSSTWVEYEKMVRNQIIPHLGDTYLQDLKRAQVKEWLVGIECSNKRLMNLQSVLRSALTDAVMDEEIEVNVLQGWAYRRKDELRETDDVDPFSIDEQKAILKASKGQFRNLIQFAFWTGMRTSELVGLNWGDVDWINHTVRVTRVKTQKSDVFETTKTRAGARTIKLLEPALKALTAQKEFTYMKGEEVFQDPRHLKRWVGDYAIRETFWVHALRTAKVRYRRPYQTRHTYASMMLSSGESPMWVAKQMGHSDWTMIARVYGKWIPDANPTAGNLALGIFGKAANEN